MPNVLEFDGRGAPTQNEWSKRARTAAWRLVRLSAGRREPTEEEVAEASGAPLAAVRDVWMQIDLAELVSRARSVEIFKTARHLVEGGGTGPSDREVADHLGFVTVEQVIEARLKWEIIASESPGVRNGAQSEMSWRTIVSEFQRLCDRIVDRNARRVRSRAPWISDRHSAWGEMTVRGRDSENDRANREHEALMSEEDSSETEISSTRPRRHEPSDITQAGHVAIADAAILGYSPRAGSSFTKYASKIVRNAMVLEANKLLPPRLRQILAELSNVTFILTIRLKREPTRQEIADELTRLSPFEKPVTEADIVHAIRALPIYQPDQPPEEGSVDDLWPETGAPEALDIYADGHRGHLPRGLGLPDDLDQAILAMGDEFNVIAMRVSSDMSDAEIGKALGISDGGARQRLSRAFEALAQHTILVSLQRVLTPQDWEVLPRHYFSGRFREAMEAGDPVMRVVESILRSLRNGGTLKYFFDGNELTVLTLRYVERRSVSQVAASLNCSVNRALAVEFVGMLSIVEAMTRDAHTSEGPTLLDALSPVQITCLREKVVYRRPIDEVAARLNTSTDAVEEASRNGRETLAVLLDHPRFRNLGRYPLVHQTERPLLTRLSRMGSSATKPTESELVAFRRIVVRTLGHFDQLQELRDYLYGPIAPTDVKPFGQYYLERRAGQKNIESDWGHFQDEGDAQSTRVAAVISQVLSRCVPGSPWEFLFTECERRILNARYVEGQTLSAIGTRLGVTTQECFALEFSAMQPIVSALCG